MKKIITAIPYFPASHLSISTEEIPLAAIDWKNGKSPSAPDFFAGAALAIALGLLVLDAELLDPELALNLAINSDFLPLTGNPSDFSLSLSWGTVRDDKSSLTMILTIASH